jgi:ATP/maltotriose-dependent transcriptional regulator MalT
MHLNRAIMLARQKRIAEARDIVDTVLAEQAQPSLQLLQEIARTNEAFLLHNPTGAEKAATLHQLAEVYENIYAVTSDPFIRYRQAQVVMFLGNCDRAAELFAEAWRRAPETAHYKQAAAILAVKMQDKPL